MTPSSEVAAADPAIDVGVPAPANGDEAPDPAPTPRIRPRRVWPFALVLLALTFALIVVDSAMALRTFPPIGLEVDIPALVWILLVTAVLGAVVALPVLLLLGWGARRAGMRGRLVVVAGLVGVVLFLLEAGRLHNAAAELTGIRPAWADGSPLEAIVIAPLIEEPLKLLGVLLVAAWFRPRLDVRRGLIVGAAIGLAVNLIEAGIYTQAAYGGGAGAIYGTVIALRFGLFGLGLHLTTAALLGAAVGAAMTGTAWRHRIAVVGGALAATLVVHAAWNATASDAMTSVVLFLEPHPDFSANEPVAQHIVWLASSAITLVISAPLLAALAIAWRRGRGSSIVPPVEAPEVAVAVVPAGIDPG